MARLSDIPLQYSIANCVFCFSVNRKPDHVLAFVLAELGTTGSIGGDNKLIIKGRFQSKQLENVLRKYIGTPYHRTCHEHSAMD